MTSADLAIHLHKLGLDELGPLLHLNGISDLDDLQFLDEAAMIRMGITSEGRRCKIIARLKSVPRHSVLDDTPALNAAREAEGMAEVAVKAMWNLDDTAEQITAQSRPPHPIKDISQDRREFQQKKHSEDLLATQMQLSDAAHRRFTATTRQEEAVELQDEAAARVWDARIRTKHTAIEKVAAWLVKVWILRGATECCHRWYLHMRGEVGALRALYVLRQIHRDRMRHMMIRWRECALQACIQAEQSYAQRRAKRRGGR